MSNILWVNCSYHGEHKNEVKKAFFEYANKTNDELYKLALNMVLEKTSCFLVEKS